MGTGDMSTLRAACAALLCAALTCAVEVPEILPLGSESQILLSDSIEAPEEGLNVAECWRIKSLYRCNGNREGLEWAISSLQMFTTDDCSGPYLNGTSFSSGDAKASDPAGRDGQSQNAFDTNPKTVWQAKRLDAGEYLGLKLPQAKEVRCIKVKQDGIQHGVRSAVLEKSPDCQIYGRVTEFPTFPDSYDKLSTHEVPSLGIVPAGVFQIRSRVNMGKCVGLEVPEAELEDVAAFIPQKNFDDGAKLEIQTCSMPTIPQYFYFDTEKRIASAKDPGMVVAVPAAEARGAEGQEVPQSPQEGGGVVIKRCDKGCKTLNSAFKMNEKEGLIIHRATSNFILEPTKGAFADKTAIITTACTDGDFANCKDKTSARWDLVPLFTVIPGKKAVNCGPYSHHHPSTLQPKAVANEAEAQQLCAADKKCTVYMYVEPDAADATASERGKAWLCWSLDVVYSGKSGYKLGFKAKPQNFIEEEQQAAKYEMETGRVAYDL